MFRSDTQYKMTTLNIKDLKPGMILASPVYNLQGVMILGKGIEITNKHLSMLKSWGTLEADVESVERNQIDTAFEKIDEENALLKISIDAFMFKDKKDNLNKDASKVMGVSDFFKEYSHMLQQDYDNFFSPESLEQYRVNNM